VRHVPAADLDGLDDLDLFGVEPGVEDELVPRLRALTDPAYVVDAHPGRDGADQELVGVPMCPDDVVGPGRPNGAVPELAIASPAQSGYPDPASVRPVLVHLRPEAFLGGEAVGVHAVALKQRQPLDLCRPMVWRPTS
jgi:hypothetical protein